MILDALIKQRLGDGWIVDFAVAVAAVSDDVHDDVAAERGAIFRGKLSDAHDSVRVLSVHVEDRHGLALGEIGCEARGVFLRGAGGEADQIVHDDVNRATDGIGLQVREIHRFRKNALAREGRVAVHHDGDDLVQRFRRTVLVRAAQAVARLLGAGAAHGYGIDGFEMAGIRNEMDADFLAGAGDISARCAHVIFHVARAENAARVDVFKTCDHFVRRLARGVDHYVQAAAMTHGHDGFDGATLGGGVQDGIEQRDQRGDAFQGEAFGAEIAGLQNLFEEIGANQAFENFLLIDFVRGGFDARCNPALAIEFRQVREISTDRAAIDAARVVRNFARQCLQSGMFEGLEQAEGIECCFQIAPAAESLKNALTFVVDGRFRATVICGLLGRLRRFCGSLFFQGCTVCHK